MADWFKRWLWPDIGGEARHLAGGDSLANSLLAAYDIAASDPNTASAYQTAAVEFSLGMFSRAFMLAEPDPPHPAITPEIQAKIARQLIARGNSVWALQVSLLTGELELLPVASYELSGNVVASSWRYQIQLPRPSGEPIVRNVPYPGIVHVRYGASDEEPWLGVSPLTRAGVTAKQLGQIENSLAFDARPRGGYIMPIPDGSAAGTAGEVTKKMAAGIGGVQAMETTASGFGQGEYAAPKADWEQRRFGAAPPAANITLKESAALAVMAACGIPPSLYTSQGAAQRESYRHFLTNSVRAVGKLIQRELAEKLEIPGFRFHFPEEFVSDISARSRGLASMIKQAGVLPEDAYNIVGLRARQAPDVVLESPQQD